ncbi:SelT/SelW/SelH family protein [Pseudalkalibacillus hwajinpoensis]|uniref:SelT/SelW/SelH family protein n=1 Tax=Guptibacillus hwajinpoensis TaxID=208199 RepID=A0A4U1MLZ3_9BACL|nr:SelT/SelW/SelH family protein [Pseudalkalibacillus hwajinpoensis]
MFNHFRGQVTSLELMPSSGGAFEITVNGDRMHSKLESGQYPDTEEFIKEMEKLNL